MTELKAEVLDAIKAIDGMTQWTVATSTSLEFLRNLLFAQNAQIEALQKREEVLRKALEFYADKEHVVMTSGRDEAGRYKCLVSDLGEKAESALNALKSIKE